MWWLTLLNFFLVASASKTLTSDFPFGSCGLKNPNQTNPIISAYNKITWSTTILPGYFTANLTKTPCVSTNLLCAPETPCQALCEYTKIRFDALHMPIASNCLAHNVTARLSPKPCTTLIVNNFPAIARYKTPRSTSWNPVSLDINTCDKIPLQLRINTKPLLFSATDQYLLIAIPQWLFNTKDLASICTSKTSPDCVIVPYLNAGIGAHAYCPIVPAQPTPSFEARILEIHNSRRALHNVPPLTWNPALAAVAQDWSNKCVFQHSTLPYGENIAIGPATPELVAMFYDNEVCLYNYSNPRFSSGTGHFTQVVWRSTREIGCALSTPQACPNGIPLSPTYRAPAMLTCEYNPPGNYAGQYTQNVPPPIKPARCK